MEKSTKRPSMREIRTRRWLHPFPAPMAAKRCICCFSATGASVDCIAGSLTGALAAPFDGDTLGCTLERDMSGKLSRIECCASVYWMYESIHISIRGDAAVPLCLDFLDPNALDRHDSLLLDGFVAFDDDCLADWVACRRCVLMAGPQWMSRAAITWQRVKNHPRWMDPLCMWISRFDLLAHHIDTPSVLK